jgi:hypothetical protein
MRVIFELDRQISHHQELFAWPIAKKGYWDRESEISLKDVQLEKWMF